MSILDSLLGAAGQNLDVGGIASQLGIDPEVAQKAIAALGAAHGGGGDTVEAAASATGIDVDTINQVLGALGGHEGLGQVAEALASNPQVQGLLGSLGGGEGLGGLAGLAGGLFGKD